MPLPSNVIARLKPASPYSTPCPPTRSPTHSYTHQCSPPAPVALCPHYHTYAFLSSHNLTLLSMEPLCTRQSPCPFLAKPGYPPQLQALWMLWQPLPSPCHRSLCPSHKLTAHIQYFHRGQNVTKDCALVPISKPFWYHHFSEFLKKYAFSIY